MKLLRAIGVSLILALLVLTAVPRPVRAIADPDTPPSVNAVYVYQDLLETGDVGILVDYFLDYAVLPTETATEAYLVVFVDTDGTTQLRSVAPYTFQDSGYGRGVAWIYFSAADASAHAITSAGVASYKVWLTGNPALTFVPGPNPPKTIAGIDQWNTTGDQNLLLALRVLYYADVLELAWSLDLVQSTAMGSKLTTLGESYFTNAITNLRNLAPDAFSSSQVTPGAPTVTYNTAFGATAANGTATLVGGPTITLVEGNNTIDTGATTGTITLTLAEWTTGSITNGTGTVTGNPVSLYPGVNTVTITVAGTFTVAAAHADTITELTNSVTGTGFDMTNLAAAFGMSRWTLSTLIWVFLTIVICAAVYRAERQTSVFEGDSGSGGSKSILVFFTLCLIGGQLLGLLHPLVLALLIIIDGALVGYVFFFQSDALHKGFMFMVWMFIVTSFAGNMVAGSNPIVATYLTADVAAGTVNTIPVASTTGFAGAGTIQIGDEQIGYPNKTGTAFTRASVLGTTTNPILRGMNGSTDAAHSAGATVRTVEAGMMNASLDYKIARITDNAGIIDYLSLPIRLLDLVMTFFILPLDFLGTDLAIITYIWGVIAAGMIFGIVNSILGNRRI